MVEKCYRNHYIWLLKSFSTIFQYHQYYKIINVLKACIIALETWISIKKKESNILRAYWYTLEVRKIELSLLYFLFKIFLWEYVVTTWSIDLSNMVKMVDFVIIDNDSYIFRLYFIFQSSPN